MELLSVLSQRVEAVTPAPEFIVAYSGGIDSQVLLHAMTRLRKSHLAINLKAIHVHHGLSPNADDWLAFCQQQCQTMGVAFQSIRISVNGKGAGIEAAAREARYAALEGAMIQGSVLMTAHHADDQLETLLLQLKRGAGPKGLAGIAPVMALSGDKTLIRPLLGVKKQSIEAYATKHGLAWVEDESNADTRFERNFLRSQVLPLLTRQWPHLTETAARTTSLCARQSELVEQAASEKLANLCDERNALDVTELLSQTALWRAEIIRCWLQRQGCNMPSQAQMAEIEKIVSAREDAVPLVNLRAVQIRRFKERLYCVAPDVSVESALTMTDGIMSLPAQGVDLQCKAGKISLVPNCEVTPGRNQYVCLHPPNVIQHGTLNVHVQADQSQEQVLSIRSDRLASPFKPKGERHSKPLKQWFKTWGVAPWSRKYVLQVWAGESLIGVVIEGRLLPSV